VGVGEGKRKVKVGFGAVFRDEGRRKESETTLDFSIARK
jgi:hypothetical protein